MLWRDNVVGWANVAVKHGALDVGLGFMGTRPATAIFRRELDAELARLATFLDVAHRPRVTQQG